VGVVEVVLGPYRIEEQLSVGRNAELYLATLPDAGGLHKKVVIKRLLPALEADEPSKALFIDEVKLAAKLVHPRIAQTFELASQGPTLYVPIEHVDGTALDVLARELSSKQRKLEPQLAVWIAQEMLDALDFAHRAKDEAGNPRAIVHGDLSTSKVILSARGDVKLVGFGSTTAQGDAETWRDVFATGVVVAELLTGHRLFAAANDLRVLRLKLERFERCLVTVDPALADIVRRALRTATDIRWDAAGFRDALGDWLSERHLSVTAEHVAALVNHTASLDALPQVAVAKGPVPEVAPYVSRSKKPSIEIPAISIPSSSRGSEPKVATTTTKARGTGDIPPLESPRRKPSREIPALVVPPRAPSSPTTTEIAFDDIGEPVETPKLTQASSVARKPDEVGDFTQTAPIAVLFKLMAGRASGTLAVAINAVKKDVVFADGRPVAVASNLAGEQLGNYLVAHGALSNGELSLVLATLEQRGGDMGELVVELGLVESRDLRRHWSALTQESVVDVGTWMKGTYSWFSGLEGKSPMFRLEANPFELLGAAALGLDERLVLPTTTAMTARRPVVAPQPRVDPNCFGLAGMDDLVAALDGTRTVEEIARSAPERLRCYRMVALLEACELLAK
jgi:hypothetical protein